MSKAFIKETEHENDPEPRNSLTHFKNYVTTAGFSALQNELRYLMSEERPKIVEVVRWAAGNGDRSENGDYIYGKKRLREIDRRVRYLTKQIESAEIVAADLQKNLTKVFFGATVTYAHQDGKKIVVQLVGIDEADLTKGKISWVSPVATALLKSQVGDVVEIRTPSGCEVVEVLGIKY